MSKKIISIFICNISPYDFEGSVKYIIEELKIDISTYGDDCFFNYDGETFLLYRKRLETDKEYSKRLKIEAVIEKMELYKKKKKEKRELKEYQRLHKKFGKKEDE